MKTNCTICGGSGVINGTKQLPDVACTCQRNKPLTQLIDKVAARLAMECANKLDYDSGICSVGDQRIIREHIKQAILEIVEPLEKYEKQRDKDVDVILKERATALHKVLEKGEV